MKPAVPDHAGDPAAGVRAVNLPNALTVLRLAAVPMLVWLLVLPDARWWAALVFVLASATDFADGALARRRGQVTTFGKVVDPIADKALTGAALIGLSALGLLAWWITVVILLREIAVTLLRMWVIRHGVIPASRGGKAKTVTQMIAITMYLAPVTASWWIGVSEVVMAFAVVLTLATGLDYLVRALRLRSAASR